MTNYLQHKLLTTKLRTRGTLWAVQFSDYLQTRATNYLMSRLINILIERLLQTDSHNTTRIFLLYHAGVVVSDEHTVGVSKIDM